MASWEPDYAVKRRLKAAEGKRRRQEAWLLLGMAASLYAAWWSVRSFLG